MTRTLQRGWGLFLLPQQFEDSLVMRKFQGVHDENTRPAGRKEVTVGNDERDNEALEPSQCKDVGDLVPENC